MNPQLVILSGPDEGKAYPLSAVPLIIGRDPASGIVVQSHAVSRSHASIVLQNNQSLLADLQSVNGTYVNGIGLDSKVLVHGDRLMIGDVYIAYLDHDDADERLCALTPEERQPPTLRTRRQEAYQAADTAIIKAFHEMSVSISALRDVDEIQARVLQLIFRVIPADQTAILTVGHDPGSFVSGTYRRIGSDDEKPFAIDDGMTQQVLREGKPVFDLENGIICVPLSTYAARVGVIYVVSPATGVPLIASSTPGLLQQIAGSAALTLEHARYVAWIEGDNRRMHEDLSADHGMIGHSPKMQEVYRLIAVAGPADRPVLITGPTGTGKELIARALHRMSPRSGKALLTVNCAALPEHLIESELFGHEKGAFTGAMARRAGLFEAADGGTIFLDEIGELPISLQAKLLRVLQEGEIRRLGSTQTIHVHVRVIAATNRNLEEEVRGGRFREDLLFRLQVISIELPSLADRREDIPLLAAHFIKKYGEVREQRGLPSAAGITPEAHRLLEAYAWPGNVRELEHAIDHAMAMGDSEYIRNGDLPRRIRGLDRAAADGFAGLATEAVTVEPAIRPYEVELDAFRKSVYTRALQQTDGNFEDAARLPDVNVKSLYRACRDLGVHWP
jgi:transcriptional regulator with GAF, ATPase, and Fis domain